MKIVIILIALLFSIAAIYQIIKTIKSYKYYKRTIESYGYTLEELDVTTEDGYILSLWHLLPKEGKQGTKVVYLVPGIHCTGWAFFQLGENSLPFLLVEEGFDVWISNNRGTSFSLGHISKDSSKMNGDYWDFSLDELAKYDLPATIDFIKEKTRQKKINYIGHSQGTLLFFMLYMSNPTYIESSIDKYVALGAVLNMAYSTSSILDFVDKLYTILDMKPMRKGYTYARVAKNTISFICKVNPEFCRDLFDKNFSLKPTNNIDYDTFWKFLIYYPGGASKNIFLHWDQIYQLKKLVYFNEDYSKNKDKYEEYDMNVFKNWKIKMLLQVSDADSISISQAMKELQESITDKSLVTLLETPNYGHLDDYGSKTAPEDIYDPVIEYLSK